jgi:hypothetical protein
MAGSANSISWGCEPQQLMAENIGVNHLKSCLSPWYHKIGFSVIRRMKSPGISFLFGPFFIELFESLFQNLAYSFGAVREAVFVPVILNPIAKILRQD